MESTHHTTFLLLLYETKCKALMYGDMWTIIPINPEKPHQVVFFFFLLHINSPPVQGKRKATKNCTSKSLVKVLPVKKLNSMISHNKFWWVSNIRDRTMSVSMFWFFSYKKMLSWFSFSQSYSFSLNMPYHINTEHNPLLIIVSSFWKSAEGLAIKFQFRLDMTCGQVTSKAGTRQSANSHSANSHRASRILSGTGCFGEDRRLAARSRNHSRTRVPYHAFLFAIT